MHPARGTVPRAVIDDYRVPVVAGATAGKQG